jgi:hypothetical protein
MARRLKDGRLSVYTYQDGWDRMIRDSKDIGAKVGDILLVANRSTGERSEWRVTQLARFLGENEARTEWEADPFLTAKSAKGFQWFPYVLENLERLS